MVRRVTRRGPLALLLLLFAAGCATDIDCDCTAPVGRIEFVGTVRDIELGNGNGAPGNDRVTFSVEQWRLQDPSIGASADMVVQYEGTAHYLDEGDTVAVGAANFVDQGWISGIEPRGTCSCAPATTEIDGGAIDTGPLATLAAMLSWWQVALGVVIGVGFTLGRRWVWRWRHLRHEGVRAAMLSTVTMIGAIVTAVAVVALVTYDRSRAGAEVVLWSTLGVGMALLGMSFLRRTSPASD
jgi:hypothetical protein